MNIGASVSVAALMIGVEAVGAQAPTFTSTLEAVRVDALVTEKGQIVRGLMPADFEVRDNGVLQQVDLVSFQQIPLNVILAFDVSASVAGERLVNLKSAGNRLLERLVAEDRAALVTFSHVVTLREALTTDTGRVRAALGPVEALGETALVDGAYAAMTLADPNVGRNLLIVFSDGLDTLSFLAPAAVLEAARRSEVVVYGVSTRGNERSPFLADLTELTGGAIIEIESAKDLSATFLRILEEFRHRYLLSFSPNGVSTQGWHRLDVRVKGRKASVRSRSGYQAGS